MKNILGGIILSSTMLTIMVISITKPAYKVTYPDGRVKYTKTATEVEYGGCRYIMLDDSSMVSINFDIVEL